MMQGLVTLISLKEQQLAAVQEDDWTLVSALEIEYQTKQAALEMDMNQITREQAQLLYQLQELNETLQQKCLSHRQSTLESLLEIKKGQKALDAYR